MPFGLNKLAYCGVNKPQTRHVRFFWPKTVRGKKTDAYFLKKVLCVKFYKIQEYTIIDSTVFPHDVDLKK